MKWTNMVQSSVFILCMILNPVTSLIKHEKETIVLLSFDGFRHDYIERENLEHFKELGNQGVRAKSLKPTFVTKTFPNHFTIVTGLYEESHGIVGNYMYDPLYKEHFDPITSSSDSKWWNSTVPIWILNEVQYLKNNNERTRKSAAIHWPGSEASYQGRWPYYTIKQYNSSFTTKNKFDKIIDLLTEPNPVNFIACYIDEPDMTSHAYGPNSVNTSRVLRELNDMLGEFIEKLKRIGLFQKVNLLLVSDHGMADVPRRNIINLTDYTNPNDYDLVNYGTFLLIRPKLNKTHKVYAQLLKMPHSKTYYRKDIPEQWNYKHNRRVTKLFTIADEHYYIAPGNQHVNIPMGDHGYDNNLESMHGIFIAHGPAFKKRYAVDTVQNIDLCILMCHVLDLKPHLNNGSFERIQHIIKERTLFSVIMKSPALIITLLSVCGILILIIVLGCTISCTKNLLTTRNYQRVASPIFEDDSTAFTQEWHLHNENHSEFDMLERDIN